MIETKVFELRDKGTFIPILCSLVSKNASSIDQENWLFRRAGFGGDLIQLSSFARQQSNYDYYEWNDRTYTTAHKYIEENWHDLEGGAVIDVELILGETEEKKKSERYD